MTTERLVVDRSSFNKAMMRGVVAAVLLAILTVIEFFVAISLDEPLLALIPFVILKGWIILDTFMHVRAVFSMEDH